MNIFKKASNIIEGWLNRFRKVHPVKEALFHDRLKICQSNECGMMKLGICTACGCPIKAKSRSVDEECPENMWNPVVYGYEDIQFINPEDLSSEVSNHLINWIEVNNKPFFLVGETPCPMAISWNGWLEFKKHLKKL